MTIDSHIIDSWESLHMKLKDFDTSTFIFRGISQIFDLVPKVGRSELYLKKENELFNNFIRQSNLSHDPENITKLENLAIAQHHGLPTRLLDWSKNPLVSLYFACQDNFEEEGILFALDYSKLENIINIDPDDISDILSFDNNPNANYQLVYYDPHSVTERIVAQRGLFTIPNDPSKNLIDIIGEMPSDEQPEIHKLIIKANCKKEILKTIGWFGVSHGDLFPGLDGLCKQLCMDYIEGGK